LLSIKKTLCSSSGMIYAKSTYVWFCVYGNRLGVALFRFWVNKTAQEDCYTESKSHDVLLIFISHGDFRPFQLFNISLVSDLLPSYHASPPALS